VLELHFLERSRHHGNPQVAPCILRPKLPPRLIGYLGLGRRQPIFECEPEFELRITCVFCRTEICLFAVLRWFRLVVDHSEEFASCGVHLPKMLSAAGLWTKFISLWSYLTFPVDKSSHHKR